MEALVLLLLGLSTQALGDGSTCSWTRCQDNRQTQGCFLSYHSPLNHNCSTENGGAPGKDYMCCTDTPPIDAVSNGTCMVTSCQVNDHAGIMCPPGMGMPKGGRKPLYCPNDTPAAQDAGWECTILTCCTDGYVPDDPVEYPPVSCNLDDSNDLQFENSTTSTENSTSTENATGTENPAIPAPVYELGECSITACQFDEWKAKGDGGCGYLNLLNFNDLNIECPNTSPAGIGAATTCWLYLCCPASYNLTNPPEALSCDYTGKTAAGTPTTGGDGSGTPGMRPACPATDATDHPLNTSETLDATQLDEIDTLTWTQFANAVVGAGYDPPCYYQYEAYMNALPRCQISTRIEAAMALAHFIHESGGLLYKRESCFQTNCTDREYNADRYADCSSPGQYYYGRGYIQLTWPYNYGWASKALYGNTSYLLANPDIVADDEQVTWDTSCWYWAYFVHPDERVSQRFQFGASINDINGAYECSGGGAEKVSERLDKYNAVLKAFGLEPNWSTAGCFGENTYTSTVYQDCYPIDS